MPVSVVKLAFFVKAVIVEKIEKPEFEALIAGAKVISRDSHGDKVFLLRDGQILKLFRLKRILSSALIWPYGIRFSRGARKLQERKIPTVTVTAMYRVRHIRRDAVIYRPIDGATLRKVVATQNCPINLLGRFAGFLANLHDQGVYFRSIHFGNVIVLPDGYFGLIDLVDISTQNSPLRLHKRLRNIKHVFSYPEDRRAIFDFGVYAFADAYLENTGLPLKVRTLLINHLQRYLSFSPRH